MSKKFINNIIEDIKPSGIRKFFDIANSMDGVISLGVGEPDFDTPWNITEVGIYTLEKGKTFYTSNAGLIELRKSITKYLKRKYNINYNYENEVLVTVGASEAIDLALRCIIEPGDEVIIPTPCYVSYEPCARLAGGIVKKIGLKEENNFMLTAEELEKIITSKTKLLILSFPNNPTGSVMDYQNLKKISEICVKYDIAVISDEIYSELCYDYKHVSIASCDGMRERTIVINGFSKTFSMTGWRIGYACGPKEILLQMTKLHQFAIMCAPTNSQFAAIEALENSDNEVEKMRNEYKKRRDFLVNKLNEIGLDCQVPNGAFYVFPSIKKFGLTSEEFCLKLLEQEKVVVVPGNAFGESGEGYIRLSYAYSVSDLEIALEKIESFIKKL